ncbi:TPA: site-specific DNA-methyltransferase, partial [Escherichia coli]
MTHKPYISPSLSLYHAQAHDVLRMLPENSVDALITDPPYSSGATHKAGRT